MAADASPKDWVRLPLIVSFANKPCPNETYGFAGNSGKTNHKSAMFQNLRSSAVSQ